jgi:hypothetical protein
VVEAQVAAFAADGEMSELQFPAQLSAFERLVVHGKCEALGLQHQSVGEDEKRAVRCFKQGAATQRSEATLATQSREPAEAPPPSSALSCEKGDVVGASDTTVSLTEGASSADLLQAPTADTVQSSEPAEAPPPSSALSCEKGDVVGASDITVSLTEGASSADLPQAPTADTVGESLTARLHCARLERLQSHPLADELPLVVAFNKTSVKVRCDGGGVASCRSSYRHQASS